MNTPAQPMALEFVASAAFSFRAMHAITIASIMINSPLAIRFEIEFLREWHHLRRESQ
ncbi:hypothetical protein ACW910_22465 (plasmid) [Burkholderia ambifaria]